MSGIISCMNTRTILILLSPLIGIFFGAFIAYQNNISMIAFSSNIIAVVLGIPLALLLGSMHASFQRHLIILSIVLLGLMSASLLSLDITGVHRWITIGPTYINISMILAPLILYAISTSLGRYKFFSVLLAISVSVIHVLQPDAGQATALGCAAIVIFLLTRGVPFEIRLIGITSIGVGITLAWRQPDSLPAVEHVEHILHLAVRIGSLGVAGIVLSIISLLTPIFYILKHQHISRDNTVLAIAFIVYLGAAFYVTELGNYPVPIIGAGASSILGYYAIIGLIVVPYVFKTGQQQLEENKL
jgi:hypothetical protein